MKIESEKPGYKDVPQLIEKTNSQVKLTQAVMDGTGAYNAGKWQAAIDNFEQVLIIDPAYSDAALKDMLVNSYFRQITQLLDNNNTPYSEINQAELYYSRALALIPQSDVSSDQEKLRQFSGELLKRKYMQTADQMINDPSQTVVSVNLAFNYLSKASILDSQNSALQAEVQKMNLYRTGFYYYVDMNWQLAIQQLTVLAAIDENYASGFSKQILYEARINEGNQYYSIGAYLDAGNEYKIAETLASDRKNLTNFYLAEINLGRVLGKLGQYQEANTYFITALQAIDYEKRAGMSTAFISNLNNAMAFDKDGKYENSYNVFSETLVGKDAFYANNKINARQGNCLGLIAAYYHSSVQAILAQNNLPQEPLVASDQTLIIPVIQ
jgi:tetratricopeptide (TPR) repeat protein